MAASTKIKDYKDGRILEINYALGDLLQMIRTIIEIGRIGDTIKLSFEYDVINAERCRNFLAIAQLYEYTKNG